MGKKKELSRDLSQGIVSAHKTGKGYKALSKQFEVAVSNVQSIIKKQKKNEHCPKSQWSWQKMLTVTKTVKESVPRSHQ
jgi:hypothetical protein